MQAGRHDAYITAEDLGLGRKMVNGEQTPLRLPKGALARIDAVLGGDRKRAEFLRNTIMHEVERREAGAREMDIVARLSALVARQQVVSSALDDVHQALQLMEEGHRDQATALVQGARGKLGTGEAGR